MKQRKLKKQAEEILRSLEDKAPLSQNKGRILRENQPKMSTKNRRHSGWVTPKWGEPGKYSEAIAEGNEPQIYWDDWLDWRDSFRCNSDNKHIRNVMNGYNQNKIDGTIIEMNKKLKKLLLRRKKQHKSL